MLKSDRFGMEIISKFVAYGRLPSLKSDRFGMEIRGVCVIIDECQSG